MDKQSPHLLLRVPTPHQQSLTFCDPSPRELKRWVAGLPKANLGETARLLYQALVELNQLACSADTRLQLLELLRPEVYYVCNHLERHFLNQAVVLDERPRKVANLCQALQNHLAIGYKLIVVQEVGSSAREPLQRLCGDRLAARQPQPLRLTAFAPASCTARYLKGSGWSCTSCIKLAAINSYNA